MQELKTFCILTVCTGNICRSPVAERLLQSGLDETHPGRFTVVSAGTSALAGQPMQPLSAQIVEKHGGTADGFVARQLTTSMVREADLILALTAEHRTRILQLVPAAMKRVFTVRELDRMLQWLQQEAGIALPGSDVIEAWKSLPAAAGKVRHLALAGDPADNDVVDPFRRSAKIYEEMERQLIPSLRKIISFSNK